MKGPFYFSRPGEEVEYFDTWTELSRKLVGAIPPAGLYAVHSGTFSDGTSYGPAKEE
jgi:hypothetical protein